jgi:hypothetical protein
MHLDFQPAPPEEAHFDSVRRSWILSRYIDVYAALREPLLRQVSSNGEFLLTDNDAERHSQLYADIQADMSLLSSAEWRRQMEVTASATLQKLPPGAPIDIVRNVIQPWSSAMLLASSGMDHKPTQQASYEVDSHLQPAQSLAFMAPPARAS